VREDAMTVRRIAVLVLSLLASAAAGYEVSSRGGIQPGYFEKQEAPAYGVSKDKPIGSELGKQYEDHFRKLYEER
jgi:hypothetical protein